MIAAMVAVVVELWLGLHATIWKLSVGVDCGGSGFRSL